MAIRKLEYTVTADGTGLLPSSIQWGGIQYEDNATTVEYSIDSAYLTELEKNGKLLYRIDFNSPGAAYSPSQNLEMVDGKISRDIPYEITQYGGQMQSVLVVTALNENDRSTVIVLSLPGTIRFTAVPKKAGDVIKRLSAYEKHVEELIKEIYSVLGDSEENTEEANKLLESIKASLDAGKFDGFSPSIALSEQDNGVLLTVTDREGVETKLIKHGSKGDKGDTGEQGLKGDKGDKGEPGEVTLQYANNTFANALKGNKRSYVALTIDDVSPIEHELKVKVSSKNLIPYPYLPDEKTWNGITYKYTGDGGIHVSGVATGGSDIKFSDIPVDLIRGKTICTKYTGKYPSVFAHIYYSDGTPTNYTALNSMKLNKCTITIPENAARVQIGVCVAVTNNEELDTIVYPQVELGTTPTDYSPYVDVSHWALLVTDGGEIEDETTKRQQFTINKDGTVDGVKSIYPEMSVWCNAEGQNPTVVEVEYNRDLNKAFEETLNRLVALETAIVNS